MTIEYQSLRSYLSLTNYCLIAFFVLIGHFMDIWPTSESPAMTAKTYCFEGPISAERRGGLRCNTIIIDVIWPQ